MDSDVAPDARSVFVNQVTTELVGKNQVESIAKQIGNKGEIAILSATANATNQNAWIKVMKDTLKDPKYKDIKLVKVAYGDDDDQKSFQETQGLIQAYPNLKGIISPTTVGVAAAARYLSTSPQKGKIKLTGLGFPNQMRKYVKNGTVDEFQLWVPKDVGYLAGQAAAALVAGPHHRQGGREVQGRPSRRLHDRQERRDRARPADDVQQGQHRRLRLLSRSMTVTDPSSPLTGTDTRPGPRARVGVFGIGLAAYWPQFEGLKERIEGYQRRVEERVRELGGDVISAGLVDSEQAGREAGDRFAAAQVDLVVCHAVTYATSSTVLPVAQAAKAPVLLLGLQPTQEPRLRQHRHRRVAGQLRRLLRAGAGGRVHARAASPTTPSPGTIDDDERAWAKIGAWVRAAGVARALRRSRIGFLGHVYPGMLDMYTDFTMSTRRSARTSRCWRSTTSARGWRRPPAAEVEAKVAEIRAMFAFADPSDDPIAGPIEPDGARLVGARRGRPRQARRPTSSSTR